MSSCIKIIGRAAATSSVMIHHINLSLPIPCTGFLKILLNFGCWGCFNSQVGLQELERSSWEEIQGSLGQTPPFLNFVFAAVMTWMETLFSRCGWDQDCVRNWVTGAWNCGRGQAARGIGSKQSDGGWKQGCCENVHVVEAVSYYGDGQHHIHHWGNESCPWSKAFRQ